MCVCVGVSVYERERERVGRWMVWMLCKATYCTGCILTNTRPHQLYCGDREMGTA